MRISARLHSIRTWTGGAVSCLVAIASVANSSVAQGAETRFAAARIIIEFNSTDQDVGVQVFLDGQPWRKVQLTSPDGRILDITGTGNLSRLGLTELFFESEEPSLEDVSLDEFLTLFPEGDYELKGETADGNEIVGTARLTHRIPAGPKIVTPGKGSAVDPDDAVISWNPVTEPEGIDIVGYQVIVERDQPHRTFDADLPAAITSVLVPPQFLEPGTAYKMEVLAIDASGNQTITENSFRTAEK